jgi:hypothetical protein
MFIEWSSTQFYFCSDNKSKMAASAGVGMKGKVFYESSSFYYYNWVDTSAGGLLVPDGIILPVVECFGNDMVY